jgi:hypothetical protein
MAIQTPAGSVFDNYREQIERNPASSANITAGGTSGTNTATFDNTVGLYVGDVITLTGGTAEAITVYAFNAGTGVAVFYTNIVNAGHTGATWGYGSPISDEFDKTADAPQTPFNPTGTLSPAYLTQQPVRSWYEQRARGVQT